MRGLVSALVAVALLAGSGGAQRPAPATATARSSDVADTARTALLRRADLARIRGAESAVVWLVVISDFQCPFCKRWHEETAPRLERTYVRTGKVRIAYLNYPVNTHRNAPPAHELAMCAAEQDQFWPVADALFASQDAWKGLLDPTEYFATLVSRLNIDHARLTKCLESGATRALVRADYERSARIGVTSTPSFLIDGRPLVGAQPYEVFAQVIDEALARRAAAPR